MLAQMTASEWLEWQAFYQDVPDREEHYLRILVWLVANGNANFSFERKKPFGIDDFDPDLLTPQERLRKMRRFAEAQAQFDTMLDRAKQEAQTEKLLRQVEW